MKFRSVLEEKKKTFERFCINHTYVICFEATKLDLRLIIFYSSCVMNTCSQMTGYYLFKWFYKKNRLLSIVTWEVRNIEDLGSTLIMKFKEEKFKYRTNWFMELVVKPGCYAELLITGITVSGRGYMIAPDWWSLWMIKAKCLKGCWLWNLTAWGGRAWVCVRGHTHSHCVSAHILHGGCCCLTQNCRALLCCNQNICTVLTMVYCNILPINNF